MKTATTVLPMGSLAGGLVWVATLMGQAPSAAVSAIPYPAPYPAPYRVPVMAPEAAGMAYGSLLAYPPASHVMPAQAVSPFGGPPWGPRGGFQSAQTIDRPSAAGGGSILTQPPVPPVLTTAPPPPPLGASAAMAAPMPATTRVSSGGQQGPMPEPVPEVSVDAEGIAGPASACGCDDCTATWQGYGAQPLCTTGLGCGLLRGHLARLVGIGAGCDPLGCGGCGPTGCTGCGTGPGLVDPGVGCSSRLWLSADYLLWWNKNRTLPALVTSSPDGTPREQAGVLGQPGTSILFGGGEIDDEPESGARIDFGLWLDSYQTVGLGARMFQLGEEEIDFRATSGGSPILARPFVDVDQGQEDALLVAFPGVAEGSVDVEAFNRIRGVDVFLRKLLYAGYCNRVDLIGGYQFTEIDDRVTIFDSLISTDPDGRVPVGTQIDTLDLFDAQNEFHGGTIGLLARADDGRLTWRLVSKIAFGNMHETVTIRGQTITTIPGGPADTTNMGLLALPTNIGQYEQDQFVVVPEATVSVHYALTNRLQVGLGYSLIYWSRVVLAGDAIDRSINPTQIDGDLVGLARPSFSFRDQTFWAQGIHFGLLWRY